MACFHPRKGYRSKTVNPSGKRSIVFNPREGFHDLPIDIACGQCIGCRLERSRQWAIRCVHEASLYDENAFLTLTYSDPELPPGGTLEKSHHQLFMKRLRFHINGDRRKKFIGPHLPFRNVRYFHCGEYGETTGRPHYHTCLFNYDFNDKKKVAERNGHPVYHSPTLEQLWPHGHHEIGTVTFESAAYVARYITKKITGPMAGEHYQSIDTSTGEVFDREPEYVTMSRRPGIGKPWLEKFKTDVYPHDFVVIRGVRVRAPKYYDSEYAKEHPQEFEKLKNERKTNALKHEENNTWERLAVREECQVQKFLQLKRNYENGS